MTNGDGSNGLRVDVANIKEDVKELKRQVHDLELKGCAHKAVHERTLEEVWKRMEKNTVEIQELKGAFRELGTKIGIYVGLAVAVITIAAQAIMRYLL